MKREKLVQSVVKHNFQNLPPKEVPFSYIPINKRFLHVDDRLNFNLYNRDNLANIILFLEGNSEIDVKIKEKLKEVDEIYVHENEKNKYEFFLEKHLQEIILYESLTLDEKTDIIYASTKELTHSLYENPDALENAQRSENIVKPILNSIIHNKDTIASYIKIIEYDYYTHTHSLNVAIYTLCLGTELGLSEQELTALGRAALLHDLGKSRVERTIVNKNGILSESEFNKMKAHPSFGYDIAIEIGISEQKILDGIRHHHEKLDGMGYPDSLKGDEITLFPRIIGVCDVFDALTTRRSYKNAMRSFEAFNLMKTEMNTHLDMDIVKVFIKMLHR